VTDGYMIAAEENGEVYVGKAISLENGMVTVTLYRGTTNGTWGPVLTANNAQLIKKISIKNINEDRIFFLTTSNRLPQDIRAFLRTHLH